MVFVSVSVTVCCSGSFAVVVALFMIGPGRSFSVIVYVVVPVAYCPGFSVVVFSVIVPSLSSCRFIWFIVVSPVLVIL